MSKGTYLPLPTLPIYCTIPPPYPYIPGCVVVGVVVGVVGGFLFRI